MSRCGRALGRLPFERLSSWLARKEPKLAALDASCSGVLRSNRTHVTITFLALCAGWLVNSLESYVLMLLMGLRPTFAMAYVMESVGSLFRLVFFMLPAGIGGQDASFVALFRLYRSGQARRGCLRAGQALQGAFVDRLRLCADLPDAARRHDEHPGCCQSQRRCLK